MQSQGLPQRVRIGVLGIAGCLALLLGVLPRPAWGFDDPLAQAGRLAYFHGDVRIVRPESQGGGDPAHINMALTEGTRITTGEDGEAEIEFEDGSLVRMTPVSAVVLSRLGTGADGRSDTELTLQNGLVYAELRAAARYGYRIDAGGDAVTPVTNATVRISLEQPPPAVAVLDGTAQVSRTGNAGGYQVDVGRGESLRGDPAGGGRYFLTQQIEHNSWDDWNEEREQAAANDSAARTAARDRYAGDQGYGWSDLDANGTWYDTGQGPVWQPFDASLSGFDPYGYGVWVWYPGPGYVWSSGYRWGWTPFRCGSWNYWPDFGWGWVPSGPGGYGGGGGPGRVRRVNRINLSNVPPGYRRPEPPVPGGPVRVHPIVPVHAGPAPTGERGHAFEARQIAGQTAMPLRTLGNEYTPRGGSAVGASLRRDFPVDRATMQPVMGSVTVPAGRRGPEMVPGSAAAVRGAANEAGGRPAASGTESFGTEQGVMLGGRQATEGERRIYPGRERWPGDGSPRMGAPAAGTGGSVPQPGSAVSGSSVSGSSVSVPSPPPPVVRVHPGERSEQVTPGNRGQAPPVEMRRPMPSDRSIPAPPPPIRSAPSVAPAPMMRSAPPAAVQPMRSSPPPSPGPPPPASGPAAGPVSPRNSNK